MAVAFLFLLPVAGHPPATNPNELVRVELALSMAIWATVDLEPPARVYGLSEDVARHHDRLLADKAPGLSIAAIPLIWLSRGPLPDIPGTDLPEYWPLRHLLTGILVALGSASLFFLVAAKIPDLLPAAWLPVAVATALSTPMWTYGTVFFGHAPAAVLIAVAWLLLLPSGGTASSPRTAYVGGVAAGLAVITEYPTVLLVAVVFGFLVIRRVPGPLLGAAVAGLVTGLLPGLIYHQAAFGAPWLTGYAFKADPAFRQIHSAGLGGVGLPTLESLWGVLFGAARGLFFYSPVLLVAPVGLWLMHKNNGWKDVAPLCTAIVVYTAFAAGFVDWRAGWCAAARHLVPLVPLLAIPVMTAMAAAANRTWATVSLSIVVALSAVRGFLALVVTPFFPPEFSRPLGEIVLPSLRDGALAPNAVSAIFGVPAAFVWPAAALLAAALLTWALAAVTRRPAPGIGLVLALAIVGQLGWWTWFGPSPDPRREALRAQLLAALGHADVAARIETDIRTDSSPR